MTDVTSQGNQWLRIALISAWCIALALVLVWSSPFNANSTERAGLLVTVLVFASITYAIAYGINRVQHKGKPSPATVMLVTSVLVLLVIAGRFSAEQQVSESAMAVAPATTSLEATQSPSTPAPMPPYIRDESDMYLESAAASLTNEQFVMASQRWLSQHSLTTIPTT